MKTAFRKLACVLSFAVVPCLAHAAPIDLTFEGVIATYPSSSTPSIQNFYNGGTSSAGTSGTNYGITFSSNALAICLNTLGSTCENTSRGGLGDPNSQKTGLFFLEGANTFLDDAAGFTTGFSLFYSAVHQAGSLAVYSGLDGTGTLLGSLALPTTPLRACAAGYSADFCPFSAAGLTFAGTAQSISFAGVANQIVFDDVTFGSPTPGPQPNATPEPSSLALLLTGLGAAGTQVRRRFAAKV